MRIKECINNLDSCLELRREILEKKVNESLILELYDEIDNLSLDELIKLGNNFRKFPLGCDLIEIAVGPCSSLLSKNELLENCILSDFMGLPIHICGYAIADIAEKENLKPIELFKEIYNSVNVPIDIDHFGMYGPMRFPKEITHCYGECYYRGMAKSCPLGRIYKRLIDKEKEHKDEFLDWIKLSSSVCVNVVEEQVEGHAPPIEEMKIVAETAKKFGKVVEGIFHIGDGRDDLIDGLLACIDLDVDVFVIEGAPFNRAKDRLKTYAKAVVLSRLLCKGGVVGTNGAYENELRVGLRAGLNVILTGFPQNHHGYMCGYNIKEAKRGNFGLRRVIKIVREELKHLNVNLIDKDIIKGIAYGCNFLGDKIYPYRVGNFYLGDAHWRTIKNSKLIKQFKPSKILDDINEDIVGLLGGRYISWAISEKVEEVYISDKDKWVEKATIKILNSLGINAYPCGRDDKKAIENSKKTYITSFLPEVNIKLLKKYKNVETLL